MVFDEGYGHIFARYIDPVTFPRLTVDGLKGLAEIDPNLVVEEKGSTVLLMSGDKILGSFGEPGGSDIRGWATLTVEAMQAGYAASPKVRETSRERLYEAVFDSALNGLDPFSRYATAEEAGMHRARRDGYGGIGVRVRVENGFTRIVSVMPETPAAAAGLRANDTIVRVDGEPLVDATVREVVDRLRGRRGTTVTLTITRDDTIQPTEVELVRRHIVPQSVFPRYADGVLFIRVASFNQRTAATLEEAIERQLSAGNEVRGLVLDLRDNPGGLLDQAVAVSDLFLDEGRIVSTEGRHPGSYQRYDAEMGDVLAGRPMVVLVNGRSASSAEIVAAALQDMGRAVVVGTNSYGKGTVQSVFRLPNNGELTLTWSRFHAPSGYTLHGLGVMPNVCTSHLGDDAEAFLRGLANGAATAPAMLREWRSHTRPDAEHRNKLRAACPPVAEPGTAVETETEVARRLILDDGLYSQALGHISDADKSQRAAMNRQDKLQP